MKTKFILILLCLCFFELSAIEVVPHEDSISFFSWVVSEKLGEAKRVDTDTLPLNFPNYTLTEGNGASKSAIASIGSPYYERVFEKREKTPAFLFLNVFHDYVPNPERFLFHNNKTPCVNVWYQTAGGSRKKEERLKLDLSMNANKNFNFGGKFDYIYSRGFYANQRVRQINYSLFTSYNSDHYQLHAFINPFDIQNYENGGIRDDRYVSKPSEVEGKSSSNTQNIPTFISGDVANKNWGTTIFLTHRYNFGFYQEVEMPDTTQEQKDSVSQVSPVEDTFPKISHRDSVPNDTLLSLGGDSISNDTLSPSRSNLPTPQKKGVNTIERFVPVTSIIHTMRYSKASHRFISKGLPKELYPTRYFNPDSISDEISYSSFRNTLALSLREGFHKYAKAGLTFFANWDILKYKQLNENKELATTDETTISIGAKLSKEQGEVLTYNIYGETYLTGEHSGEVDVKGVINTSFPLGKERVNVKLLGTFQNQLPNFYHRHYHELCYWWDNDFRFEQRVRVGFDLSLKRFDCGIRGFVENISNYVYLDTLGAQQHSGSVQVLSATAYKNLKFGIFHWDNEVAWQHSSVSSVLPLPKLTIYSNMYLLAKIQKVLTLQFGVDCRYFTKFYAPSYNPTLGQFYVQEEKEVGNYPLMNVYLNMHLKYTRFYIMYYNAGAGVVGRDYFVAPHYPMNPSGIRLGLSVNFYN